MDDGFVEGLGGAETFGVPRGHFAEHHAAAILAEDFHHQIVVAPQHADAFVEGRLGQQFAGLEVLACVLENPRVVKRSAANGHTCAASGLQHVFGRLSGGDIAVAHHWQVGHGFDHAADAFELYGAVKTLRARAAVDENGGTTGIGQGAGELGRGDVVVIPAETHLGGNWDFECLDHAAHEGLRLGQLGHHCGAAAGFHHLAHGAAHVDVDGGNAERFKIQSRIAHLLGHGAKELYGERPVGVISLDELQRLGVALDERAGIDQISCTQIHPADLADDEPEWEVRVPR